MPDLGRNCLQRLSTDDKKCHWQVNFNIEANLLRNSFVHYTKQVAQWATIAHLGASIIFGDTIIHDAQRQVTLNLKQ